MIITHTQSDKRNAYLGPLVILNKRNHHTNHFVNPDGTVSEYNNAEQQRESNREYWS